MFSTTPQCPARDKERGGVHPKKGVFNNKRNTRLEPTPVLRPDPGRHRAFLQTRRLKKEHKRGGNEARKMRLTKNE